MKASKFSEAQIAFVLKQVLADWAYNADAIGKLIAEQHGWADIPSMPQRQVKPVLSLNLYKLRNLRRAVLQQTQTLPCGRNAIRQRPRQLSGMHQNRLHSHLVAV